MITIGEVTWTLVLNKFCEIDIIHETSVCNLELSLIAQITANAPSYWMISILSWSDFWILHHRKLYHS